MAGHMLMDPDPGPQERGGSVHIHLRSRATRFTLALHWPHGRRRQITGVVVALATVIATVVAVATWMGWTPLVG